MELANDAGTVAGIVQAVRFLKNGGVSKVADVVGKLPGTLSALAKAGKYALGFGEEAAEGAGAVLALA